METNSINQTMAHHFNSMEVVLRTISIKMPKAADGFEEFKVRGSALRHMGVSIECIANQFRLISEAFKVGDLDAIHGNFVLIASLLEGCSFQLKHFGLSLKSDHHHMVPACGAHNPRSPVAESGFLWEGISHLFSSLSIQLKNNEYNLNNNFEVISKNIKNFSDVLGKYRKTMEESDFALSAEHLLTASDKLGTVGESFYKLSSTLL
ncbi:hypothetical protein [Bacillus cereus]|uniref:hypothetical protein n=1 Tax=Bacillus cereus TaxID=1396 RepID=UPI003D06776E